MAFCTQCGTRLPDQARFCPRCGAAAPALDPPTDADRAGEVERPRAPLVPPAASGPELPPDGLHFGPAPRTGAGSGATTGERAEPRRAPLPPPLAPAPTRRDDDDEEDADEGGISTGTRLLVILALIAAAVLAVVFWQQRDGARPVAEVTTNASEPASEPSSEPTEVASAPLPEPEPTPTPSPTLEVAQTGDEIGSTASLDPNGEAAIPAAAIDTAFDDDPDRAGEEFPGPVTVRGTVIGLLSDSPPALSLEGRSRGNYVIADLAGDQRDALQLLTRGSVVRLRCGAVRHQSGTTVLYGCRI
jgi:hypothetical protein